jgi:hypothetical protein
MKIVWFNKMGWRYWLSIFHNHLHHFRPHLQFKGVWHLFNLRQKVQKEVPILTTSKFLLKFSFHIKSLFSCLCDRLWFRTLQIASTGSFVFFERFTPESAGEEDAESSGYGCPTSFSFLSNDWFMLEIVLEENKNLK